MSPVNRMTAWIASVPVIIQTKHLPNKKSLEHYREMNLQVPLR